MTGLSIAWDLWFQRQDRALSWRRSIVAQTDFSGKLPTGTREYIRFPLNARRPGRLGYSHYFNSVVDFGLPLQVNGLPNRKDVEVTGEGRQGKWKILRGNEWLYVQAKQNAETDSDVHDEPDTACRHLSHLRLKEIFKEKICWMCWMKSADWYCVHSAIYFFVISRVLRKIPTFSSCALWNFRK